MYFFIGFPRPWTKLTAKERRGLISKAIPPAFLDQTAQEDWRHVQAVASQSKTHTAHLLVVDWRATPKELLRLFKGWIDDQRPNGIEIQDPRGRASEPPLDRLRHLGVWRWAKAGFTYSEAKREIEKTGANRLSYSRSGWSAAATKAQAYFEKHFTSLPKI